jgi:hypothetical protein
MGKPLNDNFTVNAPKPLDDRYLNGVTPWVSTAAVVGAIPISNRYFGQTFLIGALEYWFRDGLADVNLIVKNLGGSGIKQSWKWTDHGNAAPVAGLKLETYITEGDLAVPFIADGSLLVAKINGASVVNANPLISEYWIINP